MNSKPFLIIGIIASFVVASMLNVYPLGHAMASVRPMFLAMVLAFWVMYRSSMMRVWTAFLVGIISDLLLGTHLGHQAFSAVLMAFVIRLLLLYTKELALSQAWVLGAIALIVYQVALWILQAFSHDEFLWRGVGSLISSIVLFPVFWHPLYQINRQLKERAF